MIDPDGYQLWGITQNKDEDGETYTARETVLSFQEDDAGNIDMRIDKAEPMFTPDTILMIMHRIEEENISDTGKRSWKQLKQEMQDLDDKNGDGNE